MPTYNRSKMLLERSIPSVLAQTHKNFRLLIVSDCCTDNTHEVVNSFKDNRIILLKINNRKKDIHHPQKITGLQDQLLQLIMV